MDAPAIIARLKPAFVGAAKRLQVKADAPARYALDSRVPSPFPQHKGQPLEFGSIRAGKAYVSFHLMPIYMDPGLQASISEALRKRMQGKSCFNFRTEPEPELVAELKQLVDAALKRWETKRWA